MQDNLGIRGTLRYAQSDKTGGFSLFPNILRYMRPKFKHYLFDWGDTLMVDFPGAKGPMYLWDEVAAVTGARETLAALHREAGCYLATNAQDSKAVDIVKALERVGLAGYIDQVFCFENVGHRKPDRAFFDTILADIGAEPARVAMVGDSLATDVIAAMNAGLHGIWYNPAGREGDPEGADVIHSLTELIGPAL